MYSLLQQMIYETDPNSIPTQKQIESFIPFAIIEIFFSTFNDLCETYIFDSQEQNMRDALAFFDIWNGDYNQDSRPLETCLRQFFDMVKDKNAVFHFWEQKGETEAVVYLKRWESAKNKRPRAKARGIVLGVIPTLYSEVEF